MQHVYRLFAILPALLLAGLLSGCDSSDNGGPNAALLRVENSSAVDFSEVIVRFTGDPQRYGALPAGQASTYRAFDTAYRYGYIEVVAGGETYVIQPIDYVGETPLDDGWYTFRLTIENDNLGLFFERN